LAKDPPPIVPLNLQQGEVVRVRPREKIYESLSAHRKNRGLWYDIEMERFSGQSFPVLARVERLIDERTGKMIKLTRDCIILDGAVCDGCRSTNRLFCPRAIYPYWREAWLERVVEPMLVARRGSGSSQNSPEAPTKSAKSGVNCPDIRSVNGRSPADHMG
jgi:hypothetical protein